jgi:hypothetical protein
MVGSQWREILMFVLLPLRAGTDSAMLLLRMPAVFPSFLARCGKAMAPRLGGLHE